MKNVFRFFQVSRLTFARVFFILLESVFSSQKVTPAIALVETVKENVNRSVVALLDLISLSFLSSLLNKATLIFLGLPMSHTPNDLVPSERARFASSSVSPRRMMSESLSSGGKSNPRILKRNLIPKLRKSNDWVFVLDD